MGKIKKFFVHTTHLSCMELFQNPKNRVYGIQLITIGMPRSLEQILAHYNFFIYVMRDPHSLFTAIINDFLIIIISLNVARLTHFKIRQGSNSELASS